jgi:hypothetical protein
MYIWKQVKEERRCCTVGFEAGEEKTVSIGKQVASRNWKSTRK